MQELFQNSGFSGALDGLRLMSQEAECKGKAGILWNAIRVPGHFISTLDIISLLDRWPTACIPWRHWDYLAALLTVMEPRVSGIHVATSYSPLVQGEPPNCSLHPPMPHQVLVLPLAEPSLWALPVAFL